MTPRFLLSAVLLLLFATACQRSDPRFEPVKASSASAFGRWRTMAGDRIRMEEWREFDALLQEIRLRVTADKEASGAEAVEAAMRARIDGLLFRDVLVLGYDARLRRLEPERNEVLLALKDNTGRARVERGTAAGAEIQRMREKQEKRLQDIAADIAGAKRRLEELKVARPAAAR